MAYGFSKELEAQMHAASNGRPFKVCPVCNLQQVPQSYEACNECRRLLAMKVAVPLDPGSGVKDTQCPQSYPSNDHSGYQDSISSAKFPKDKERV